jgi:hypothetical protein
MIKSLDQSRRRPNGNEVGSLSYAQINAISPHPLSGDAPAGNHSRGTPRRAEEMPASLGMVDEILPVMAESCALYRSGCQA